MEAVDTPPFAQLTQSESGDGLRWPQRGQNHMRERYPRKDQRPMTKDQTKDEAPKPGPVFPYIPPGAKS